MLNMVLSARFAMLKQWMCNPDLGEIHIEQKYRTWVENLRTDRYVTVGPSAFTFNCQILPSPFWYACVPFLFLQQVRHAFLFWPRPWYNSNSGDSVSARETLREIKGGKRVHQRTVQRCLWLVFFHGPLLRYHLTFKDYSKPSETKWWPNHRHSTQARSRFHILRLACWFVAVSVYDSRCLWPWPHAGTQCAQGTNV